MKIKTHVKVGGMQLQHNQKLARGMKVKTNIKAGIQAGDSNGGHQSQQHNQTMARGLKVKTNVKAGTTNGDIHIGG